jgi:hypothetical protein
VAVPTYRAFEVDDGGHVSAPAKIIEARSDLQAIAMAMQFVNGKAMEVWDETRRVGIIEKREDE